MTIFVGSVVGAQAQASIDANARKFLLASTYMKAGQFDRAIPLLEDLYADDPGTSAYFVQLKEAYTEMKRYDDAIRLVDDRLARGKTPFLLAERGALLVRKDDVDGAMESWAQAIAADSSHTLAYREVYRAMVSVRMYDQAIDVLLRARKVLDLPSAFRSELADLYSVTSRYGEAMSEYVEMVRESPNQQAYVRSRLTSLGENQGMYDEAIPVLEKFVRKDPTNRPVRELAAWIYREAGQFDRALDANRAIDRLNGEEGRVLFKFALDATDAGAFEYAFKALDDIVKWYPKSESAISAELSRADLHRRMAEADGESPFDAAGNRIPSEHYDAALLGYSKFLQHHPTDPRIPNVLWRMANLQMDTFHELGEAEALLKQIVAEYPRSTVVDQARFNLAEILLLRNDLDGAKLAFSRLEQALRTGELAERSRFELARIAYYQGQFESALTLVEALDRNTSTDIANDAIELKVLLKENRGPDSLDTALRGYAKAELAFRQRRFSDALDTLNQLRLIFPKHPLADEIRYKRAMALEKLGRFQEAQSAFSEVAKDFPDGYLADRSMFAVARIYDERLGDRAAAINAYSEVLLRYPGTLLGPQIRARIRKLRGDNA